MMKRFAIFSTLFVLAAWASARPPNILLILADDLGYADLSVQGCTQFKTPNIDSIAEKGIRFRQGYVSNSVCAPSRAGLLTGRIGIGFEANLPHNMEDGLDSDLPTMADQLKSAGYRTFCIGKWHLGYAPQFHPNQRGFDEFYGLLSGSRSYFADNSKKTEREGKAIQRNGVVEKDPEGSYLTDRLTAGAVDYLDEHLKKQPDQPFFMFLSYTAPHGPMHAKPGYAERFTDLNSEKRRIYAGMVTSLDEGVGQVLQCLERQGVMDETLILFLSDNGGPLSDNGSSNGPLKGKKGSLWEGGVRVPFFMRWDGVIEPAQVLDGPVSSLDLLTTFSVVAGVNRRIETNGINLWPYLLGRESEWPVRDFYWRRGGMKNCALRRGPYKWLENRRTGEQWLYHIEDDPSEKQDILSRNPEIAQQMKGLYEKWEQSIPDPAFSSGWKPKKGKQ